MSLSMAESFLRESFTFLSDILTTPPMSECISRIFLVFFILLACIPVAILLDAVLGGRGYNSIIDGFISVVFGTPGLVLAMAFCYWPLIAEVLKWA